MFISRSQAGIIGLAFWAGMAAWGFATLGNSTPSSSQAAVDSPAQLIEYAIGQPERLEAVSPAVTLRQGDPIFYHAPSLGWTQVGFVGEVVDGSEPPAVELVWYQGAVEPRGCRFEAHYQRGTFEDIINTMLPDEKRDQIQQRLAEVFEEHGDELVAAFRPVVEKSLRESAPLLEDALKASLDRHQDEFKAIGRRWEDQIIKKRIVPLIKDEVVPSIREHAEPVAKEIGRELWNRASLWRFGWRAIYDKSPLPDRELTKSEWERFVSEEAIPVFERHLDDILESQKQIFVDLSQNERIRDELEAVFKEIVSDDAFQELMKAVVRESVLENRELHAVWTRNFQSAEAKTAMRLAGKRLEPVARQIGDDLFGTRETGINPDFARVLRSQILGKDRRWLTAVDRSGIGTEAGVAADVEATQPLIIHPADPSGRFPLVMMANENEMETP